MGANLALNNSGFPDDYVIVELHAIAISALAEGDDESRDLLRVQLEADASMDDTEPKSPSRVAATTDERRGYSRRLRGDPGRRDRIWDFLPRETLGAVHACRGARGHE